MSEASIVLASDRREIERLTLFVENFGERHHLTSDDVSALNLMLDEVVINVIAHGYRSQESGARRKEEDRRQKIEEGIQNTEYRIRKADAGIQHSGEAAPDDEILVSMSLDRDVVTIRVQDTGRPFNPADAPAPNLELPIEERPVGGLGIHIVRSLTASLHHQRIGNRNVLTMTRHVALADGR